MIVFSHISRLRAVSAMVLGVAALVLSSTATAGTFTAKIQSILLYDAGQLVYVYPEGGVVGAPTCHGSNGNYLSFSINRHMGKQYLAMLMAAQMVGKTVIFATTGTCRDQSVSETLDWFTVNS